MSQITDSLNDRQREAVLCTEGPLLILAGAGSGKTRVITHRIAYLVDEMGVRPWNILAITFTNKAADEMKARVQSLVQNGADAVWVATFHSTCVRILRRFGSRLGYADGFSVYDTDDQRTVIKQIIKDRELDPKEYGDRAVLAEISSAKNHGISQDQMYAQAGSDLHERTVAEIFAEYQRRLLASNAMDFDDLLINAVRLFKTAPEVLEYYQDRFLYICVDEYQDTNQVQFDFVRLLAAKRRNLCVVGDDDQSIYHFRGADITNILSFEETFPGAKVIRLEQNYRSKMNILKAANGVISHNEGRREKNLWSSRGDGEPVKFRLYANGYEEAEGVLDTAADLVARRGLHYSDIAVLYRTNAQSRTFEEKCVQLGIPYRMVGGVNFYQRAEIKDILAYLHVIVSGRDEVAVRRIINVPRRGIGAASLAKITDAAAQRGTSFFDQLEHPENIPGLGRTAAKIRQFYNQIMVLRARAKLMSIDDLISEVLETTGYLEDMEKLPDNEEQAKRENIDELISKAADYTRQHGKEAELSGFLEDVSLVADIDSLDSSQDRLTLMTLHSAKGLEFPAVFIAGMEENLFPSYMSLYSGDPGDLEEERRLCYVGITRAKDYLELSAARQRTVRGNVQNNPVSRFVTEIPAEVLDYQDISGEDGWTYGGSWSGGHGIVRKSGYSEERAPWEDNSFGPYGSYGGGSGGFGAADSGSGNFGASGGSSPDSSWRGSQAAAGGRSGFRGSATGSPESFAETLPNRPAEISGRYGSLGYVPGDSAKKQKAPSFGKAFHVEKPEKLEYTEGDRVIHSKFGIGTVQSIQDMKKDYEVTVLFDNPKYGIRRMFAGFAKLRKAEGTD